MISQNYSRIVFYPLAIPGTGPIGFVAETYGILGVLPYAFRTPLLYFTDTKPWVSFRG